MTGAAQLRRIQNQTRTPATVARPRILRNGARLRVGGGEDFHASLQQPGVQSGGFRFRELSPGAGVDFVHVPGQREHLKWAASSSVSLSKASIVSNGNSSGMVANSIVASAEMLSGSVRCGAETASDFHFRPVGSNRSR